MTTMTLEHLHEDIKSLKTQIAHLTHIMEEDFEISDEVRTEMIKSRSRQDSRLVSHEEMREEFG